MLQPIALDICYVTKIGVGSILIVFNNCCCFRCYSLIAVVAIVVVVVVIVIVVVVVIVVIVVALL